MTESIWREALSRYAEQGSPSERLMARMLRDLLDSNGTEHIFDGWALRLMEAA